MKSISRFLVVDANILIRAVLGEKVRKIILDCCNTLNFVIPDICFTDAKKYLPPIFHKRGLAPETALTVLTYLSSLVEIVDYEIYQAFEEEAKGRIRQRDINDWPVIATALAFNSPIWTEDQDFFGTGIAAWTTDRIHLFINSN